MLIGLVGLKGSGKDTVARTLQYEFGFKKDSFAKPLKDAVASIFNWDRKLVEGDTPASREWREKLDVDWTRVLGFEVTPRKILQQLGTEVFRDNFHESIWIESFKNRVRGTENIVVSDVRFANEMQAIKDKGGMLLRIKRGKDPYPIERLREHIEVYQEAHLGLTGLEYYIDEQEQFTLGELGSQHYSIPDFPHRSEWDWLLAEDIIDYTVDNDGTLDDLQEKVRSLAVELGQSSSRLLEVTEDGIRYAE